MISDRPLLGWMCTVCGGGGWGGGAAGQGGVEAGRGGARAASACRLLNSQHCVLGAPSEPARALHTRAATDPPTHKPGGTAHLRVLHRPVRTVLLQAGGVVEEAAGHRLADRLCGWAGRRVVGGQQRRSGEVEQRRSPAPPCVLSPPPPQRQAALAPRTHVLRVAQQLAGRTHPSIPPSRSSLSHPPTSCGLVSRSISQRRHAPHLLAAPSHPAQRADCTHPRPAGWTAARSRSGPSGPAAGPGCRARASWTAPAAAEAVGERTGSGGREGTAVRRALHEECVEEPVEARARAATRRPAPRPRARGGAPAQSSRSTTARQSWSRPSR